MRRGDQLTLKLEGFAFEGKSVARVDGMVVFVYGSVPGDTSRVHVTKTRKNYLEAETTEVIVPSDLRTTPQCRHFGTCGGCKWQYVQYKAQIDFKRQHVVDALERVGGFKGVQVNPTLGAEEIYYYRNKMEFSFGDRWLSKEEMDKKTENPAPAAAHESFALGLHIPKRFDRVLDIEECWLQSERSTKILNSVRKFCLECGLPVYSARMHTGYLRNLVIREGKRTGELMVNLVTYDDRPSIMQSLCDRLLTEVAGITTITNNITERKSQVAIGDIEKVYHGPGYITERIGNRTYRISANSFFQTNTLQAERLFDTVKRMSEPSSTDVVFDLYCGTGAIALHLADAVREVVGIESVEGAVVDAQKNATINNVGNCTFILGDLKETLIKDGDQIFQYGKPNLLITDPPRAGMHDKAIRQILQMQPRRIVYVSCNPTTQARDLKLFCQEGDYTIDEVQPVDMFPHTYHVENVIRLRLNPQFS